MYLVPDTNIAGNQSVRAAWRELGRELERRGAHTVVVKLRPEPRVNGVDDLLEHSARRIAVELDQCEHVVPQLRGHDHARAVIRRQEPLRCSNHLRDRADVVDTVERALFSSSGLCVNSPCERRTIPGRR